MTATASTAVQKSTWKWAPTMPSSVFAFSSISSMPTATSIPLMPATAVSMMLSEMICERMTRGVAPMARRMPISVVRSRTVTIMMFDTPMAPASSVPSPTSHIRKLTPRKRLSSTWNSISVLNTVTADSSVGSTRCAWATVWRMRSESLLITTPGLPVTAIISTTLPRL